VIAYLDSSVILRVALHQPNRIEPWDDAEVSFTSALTKVECLRTLDRLRIRTGAPLLEQREAVFGILAETRIVEIDEAVLGRAATPLPSPLGTLDAIHLATGLLCRETRDLELVMATHDAALGVAARACGLTVVGV
jgi:predicted nucleic acid-binding protein